MDKVYLIDKESQIVIQEFENVLAWDYNFVEYDDNGRGKQYCDETTEYFTDEFEDSNTLEDE